MTRMADPPQLMDQEARFMQTGPKKSRIYMVKESLVLTSDDQSMQLEFEKNVI